MELNCRSEETSKHNSGLTSIGRRREEGADSARRLQALHCGKAAGLARLSPGAKETVGIQGMKTQR